MLYADGYSGKSLLAQLISILVSEGRTYVGIGVPKARRVLYLDWESGEIPFWRRVNELTAGLKSGMPDNLIYRRMLGSLTTDKELKPFVEKNDVGLIVVDSAAPACGESEAQATVSAFFNCLHGLNTTACVVAHVTKNGDSRKPFGSAFMWNLPRYQFSGHARR